MAELQTAAQKVIQFEKGLLYDPLQDFKNQLTTDALNIILRT